MAGVAEGDVAEFDVALMARQLGHGVVVIGFGVCIDDFINPCGGGIGLLHFSVDVGELPHRFEHGYEAGEKSEKFGGVEAGFVLDDEIGGPEHRNRTQNNGERFDGRPAET